LVKALAIILISLLGFILGNADDLKEYQINGQAQGTTYHISYFSAGETIKKTSIDSILSVIDLSMSLYKDSSVISKFNNSDGKKVVLDAHIKNVLLKSFQINKETNGAFDITVAPLVSLWGFGKDKIARLPDSSTISKIIKNEIGMNKLKLKGNRLIKSNPAVKIDLNGIAQGYSVDVIAGYLESKDVTAYVVEIGGEVRAKGQKPNGSKFKIGIEGPSRDKNASPDIKHVASFDNGAITTSGNYRKYIAAGGKNYGHIINARNGYPIQNEMISVTVFAKKAIDADGYDNALMAMGIKDALSFVAKNKNIEAYLIYKKPNGAVADTLSKGMRQLLYN
jgi:thiamine biosynthesis lipoprotein